MLPFCGYNMGKYFGHWLTIGEKAAASGFKPPKIFHVNWFRQENGQFLWPGFGDNSRVLKWITERVDDKDVAVKSPIGYLPKPGSLDLSGLKIDPATVQKLTTIEPAKWLAQTDQIETYQQQFGSALPKGLKTELEGLQKRLKEAL